MANVLEDWYPPPKSACSLVSRHICLTIDPSMDILIKLHILVLGAAIGGIACIILVVRAPIEGSAYYFRFYPTVIRRKN